MTGEQVVDLAGDLDLPRREDHEVVADALELGDHVRREDDRQLLLGDGGHQGRQELVARQWVEPRHRLVEHQQFGALGERRGEGDLRVLAA